MEADIYIIFICTSQIQSVIGLRRFKILWNSLGNCLKQIALCDIIQEDVMQIISAVVKGKDILFLL